MNQIPFLKGGGHMGALTRNFDWAGTPIGSPDSWPQSLKTIVSMILLSKFPMFLWWGKDLIQFYNDAYRPSLGNEGKHPAALGQSAEQCWPEIWPTIKPLIDQVMETGEATWSENQLIPIFRNGCIEDVYWTFGYSAVLDDTAQTGGVLVVCQEMTQMMIAKKALEQSETRLRAIIEQAPLAIGLLSGPDMVVGVGNDSIFNIWGKNKSIIGKQLIDALPELEDQDFLQILHGVYQTGEPYIGQSTLAKLYRRGVLEDVYFDFVYAPMRNETEEVTGILILAIDVTRQVLSRQIIEDSEMRYRNLSVELEQQVQHRTSELQALVRDLKRSNENLQQFAYVVSHDLQEPLRKIQAFGDLLKKKFPANLDAGVGYIERMQSAASRMSTLIEDLLSYSRIPVLLASAKPVLISEVVDYVLVDLEIPIEQAGATFVIGDLPIVTGDRSQLSQLFQNLISNAVKFQRPGVSPLIRIESQITETPDAENLNNPAQQYYRVDVTDNGIGFDNQYIPRIFQVFQRLHGRSEFEGSGIGLSICEKIAFNHGGRITANGRPGLGSTFSVYFPL
jgi:signal transduction histidine kinase